MAKKEGGTKSERKEGVHQSSGGDPFKREVRDPLWAMVMVVIL